MNLLNYTFNEATHTETPIKYFCNSIHTHLHHICIVTFKNLPGGVFKDFVDKPSNRSAVYRMFRLKCGRNHSV